MDSQRVREIVSMPKRLNRYHQPDVIEHLANQYVLGLLPLRVRRRVDKLVIENVALKEAIDLWQNRLTNLDAQTAESPVTDESWSFISEQLGFEQSTTESELNRTKQSQSQATQELATEASVVEIPEIKHKKPSVWSMFTRFILAQKSGNNLGQWGLTPAFSLVLVCLLSFVGYQASQPNTTADPLSYVAVLTDDNQSAHLVASTYGESKKLIVNMVAQQKIDDEQSLELWVISKTDGEARSLGVLPTHQPLHEQQLSNAQWRLIKDSHSLMVTVEELGGSAIGEPSELIVSRGLCVRLKEWGNNEKV